MRQRIAGIFILTILLGGWPHTIAHAEVLDRIAAVVDGHIITLSDLRREHEIQALLKDPAITDEDLVKSLIDRHLLEQEMAAFPGLDVSEDEVNDRMKQIPDLHGVPAAELRSAIVQKLQRRNYVVQRFAQSIVVSSEEIKKEYEGHFVPELKKAGIPVPELNAATEDIRNNLINEKASQNLEMYLESLRMRSSFEIFQ